MAICVAESELLLAAVVGFDVGVGLLCDKEMSWAVRLRLLDPSLVAAGDVGRLDGCLGVGEVLVRLSARF